MALMDVFKRPTTAKFSLADSDVTVAGVKEGPSEFVTSESFANFSVMAGAIIAAWKALQMLSPRFSDQNVWLPYLLAFIWAAISVWISIDALKKESIDGKLKWSTFFGAVFMAFINALILASAVVGTNKMLR